MDILKASKNGGQQHLTENLRADFLVFFRQNYILIHKYHPNLLIKSLKSR